MAKEARNAALADNNRARSDGESREDERSNGMTSAEDRVGATQPICYEDQ